MKHKGDVIYLYGREAEEVINNPSSVLTYSGNGYDAAPSAIVAVTSGLRAIPAPVWYVLTGAGLVGGYWIYRKLKKDEDEKDLKKRDELRCQASLRAKVAAGTLDIDEDEIVIRCKKAIREEASPLDKALKWGAIAIVGSVGLTLAFKRFVPPKKPEK